MNSASIHCPVCNAMVQPRWPGSYWPLIPGGRTFQYAVCPSCDLVFSDPMPTDEEVEWLYANRYDYQWFQKRRALKQIQARDRWRRLSALLRQRTLSAPGRMILDIGCGHGWFLEAAKERGWAGYGLDFLTDEMAQSAALRGLKFYPGSLLSHQIAERDFSLITMWHVLEHITQPQLALQRAADLLAPGGYLVIAVPNLHGHGYEKAGLGWVWCQKPFVHPFHYSAHSLQKVMPADLEIVHVTSRDVWDGQTIEATGAFRVAMRAIYYGTAAPRKLFTLLKQKRLAGAMDDAQFLFEEALRITTRAGYAVCRPFLKKFEANLRASELMLIARKRS